MMHVKDALAAGDPVTREVNVEPAVVERMRATLLAAAEARAQVRSVHRLAPLTLVASICSLLALLTVAGMVWRSMESPAFAAVRFEIRLAELTAAPGLVETRVGAETTIYLHEAVVVSNEHIVSAQVVPRPEGDRFAIDIRLSADGASRLRAATRGHIGKPLALMLEGKVVMAPVVRSEIGDAAVVTGSYAREEAERLARGMVPQ